ncbi:GyrI-like domain-containing protein [Celerinatantimonas diazotrophica]|uniref:Putative transcriptional regulator YdeE n=1 Tax=Celerinatantimonas diazotrophica TaxID=412034 RepID=A0A4R1JMU5_9GAMM|nr:GyrI-like domain-containing protein [Celerinatantimonas diazotrophica]TCK51839.1 putative transcriptional regulator YdeE [Celerinatantimonas diazotrophica]CAG9296469.1 hypothetical protein CEDIAZO_01620 [Celerinatantimonas diazotrophica]
METVQIKNFVVKGLAIRTSNEVEMNPETAMIAQHVQYVDANLVIDHQSGAQAYSVYYNYESDVNGQFDILMGSTEVSSSKVDLTSVEVVAGSYIKFESEGEFPSAIISAWQAVWTYFNSPDCEHSRAYTTDFEHYESSSKVSVYIALK